MTESVRIRVTKATRDRIAQMGIMDEGWDNLLNRLLDERHHRDSAIPIDPIDQELTEFIMTIANQLQVNDSSLTPKEVTVRVYGLLFILLGHKDMPDPFEVINKTALLEQLLLDPDPFVRATLMLVCVLSYFVKIEGMNHLQDELTSTRNYLIEEYKRRIKIKETPLAQS